MAPPTFDQLGFSDKLAFLPDVKEMYLRQVEVPELVPVTIMESVMISSWYGWMAKLANAKDADADADADALMKTFLDIRTTNRVIANPVMTLTIGVMARTLYEKHVNM
jgi:hypothetical protein